MDYWAAEISACRIIEDFSGLIFCILLILSFGIGGNAGLALSCSAFMAFAAMIMAAVWRSRLLSDFSNHFDYIRGTVKSGR